MCSSLRLGLIGDKIEKSQSPRLHQLAGNQCGIDVTYDRIIPAELKLDFDSAFYYASQNYRGINITYPYKELASKRGIINDPIVKAIGAVNTVLFETNGHFGYNTDYTGFIAAYRQHRGFKSPGCTLVIGTGGVGKAIAFALVALQADEIRLVDSVIEKAEALAASLRIIAPDIIIRSGLSSADFSQDIDGIVNGTPIGMEGIGGTPLETMMLLKPKWVFDAVYTPKKTQFLCDAADLGAQIIFGYELFIAQGIDAFELFSGKTIDRHKLRNAMEEESSQL